MRKAIVTRIRPVSWKICVQGKAETEHVRGVLAGLKIQTTDCQQEPDLTEPPVFAFVATPQMESPLTADELKTILNKEEQVEVAVDSPVQSK